MMISHAGTFLEKGLIHRTARGELVRSKSEVIIADLLDGLGLPYAYEQPFTAPDGSVRYPDFTIDDAETGRRLLIEHLGIVGPSGLRSALEGEGRMVSESWRTAYSRRGVDGDSTRQRSRRKSGRHWGYKLSIDCAAQPQRRPPNSPGRTWRPVPAKEAHAPP
jgi:hypothetical protein